MAGMLCRRAFVFLVAMGGGVLSASAVRAPESKPVADARVYARDLAGRPVRSLGERGTRAVVVYFVASDCPISNRTFPEMKRVREAFAGQAVRFWFVYANHGESVAAVRVHQASFDAVGEAILDTDGALARMTGAKVTPEVAVLTPAAGTGQARWVVRYTGRIDDRYVRLGLERPQAKEHFVERVVREVLDGRPVEQATGTPVGCGIVGPEASVGSGR